uniref:UBC core domain-containing protein n=1 Tax=Panagrellus redivivus TaxID=6233 RepID=A0A7E4UZF7_PANRE
MKAQEGIFEVQLTISDEYPASWIHGLTSHSNFSTTIPNRTKFYRKIKIFSRNRPLEFYLIPNKLKFKGKIDEK